jgi:hypothetical protein
MHSSAGFGWIQEGIQRAGVVDAPPLLPSAPCVEQRTCKFLLGQLTAQCVACRGLCTSCSSQQTLFARVCSPAPVAPASPRQGWGVDVGRGTTCGRLKKGLVPGCARPTPANQQAAQACLNEAAQACTLFQVWWARLPAVAACAQPVCWVDAAIVWGCTPVGGCHLWSARQAGVGCLDQTLRCVCVPLGRQPAAGSVCFGQQLPAGVCALGRPAGVCARCAAARSSRRVLIRTRAVIGGASRRC